ncbi:MAG: heme a synthase [Blastocatellia bacterium]|jgi:cytochrome c oxidase assembly protein subunit 15|nr:heme a synthase [Blastocatellia bacterium]
MSQGLHRFTLLVTGATFVLIVAGALVTSHDAGLAAPDWPLSFGQVFPRMVGNLFWEHGHRLIASTVGLLTIALNVFLYFRERRRWVRRLGLVALAAVIAQGLLGGLTVKLLLPLWVSSAHATLAQLFFCTMISLSVFTSPGWQTPRESVADTETPSLRYLCAVACVVILAQLVLGATLRHSATWDEHLPTALLLAHIGGAVLVTVILAAVCFATLQRHDGPYLRRPVTIAAGLLGLQLCLGIAAYVTRTWSPNDPQPLNPMVAITVAHVACGALVFAATIVLTLRSFQVLRAADPTSEFSLKTQRALG